MNSLLFLAAPSPSRPGLIRRICPAPLWSLLMLSLVAAHNPLLGAELDYRRPAEMLAAMEAVATRHPGICELVDYGDSLLKTTGAGGFDLMAMRITRREVPGPKPVFFLGGGIHGQEVSSGEIAMMFAEWLTDAYDHDPDATWVVDWHEIWVVPCLNPDGREATTWHNARGVDLNRNFGFQWGLDSGSSPGNRGPAPFSEPETQALRQLFLELFPSAPGPVGTEPAPDHTSGLVIQLHSNGQQTFWPWGHTTEPPPNAADFAQFALRLRQFDRYFVGQLGPALFLVSGMLDDWVYGELGVPSFLREVLDPYYTVDPPYHVVVDEFWNHNQASLLHAAKLPRSPYLTVHGPEVRDLRVIHLGRNDIQVSAWIEDGISGDQAIAAAECYFGIPPWAPGARPLPLFPDDGSFNTPRELAGRKLSLDGWALGRHLVFVRGQDTAGFWGPVSAAWVDLSENQPPRIERVSPSSTTQMQCFTPQRFAVEADDPEDDRLSYTWRLDGRELVSRGEPFVVYLPRAGDVGQRVLEVSVSDGGRVAHHSWRIAVKADPRTVVLGRGDPGTEREGTWHSSRAWYPWSWASAFAFEESATYRWTPDLPQAGTYDIYAWWTYGRPSRAIEAPYRIQHATGADTVFANQNDLNLTGRWNWLGTYDFLSGDSGHIELSAANGIVSADAVKLRLRLDQESVPTVVVSPLSQDAVEGSVVSFAVSAVGDGVLSYRWTRDGQAISGADAATFSILGARFSDAGSYEVAISNRFGVVNSAAAQLTILPALIWDPPAAITYGMALGPRQLRATTLIPGSLEYEPGPGTVLPSGEHLLRATFTPEDAFHYSTKIREVRLMVEPAPLTIRALDQVRPYGQDNPSLAYVVEGLISGDGPELVEGVELLTAADRDSPAGEYLILARGGAAPNYTLTYLTATLRVEEIQPEVLFEPEDRLALAGSQAVFQVTMADRAGLEYQWFFDGEAIQGANDRVLRLSAVSLGHAGAYHARVQFDGGIVHSREALLHVIRISPALAEGGTKSEIALAGRAGETQRMDAATALGDSTLWVPLATAQSTYGGVVTLRLPLAAESERFFRVLTNP